MTSHSFDSNVMLKSTELKHLFSLYQVLHRYAALLVGKVRIPPCFHQHCTTLWEHAIVNGVVAKWITYIWSFEFQFDLPDKKILEAVGEVIISATDGIQSLEIEVPRDDLTGKSKGQDSLKRQILQEVSSLKLVMAPECEIPTMQPDCCNLQHMQV